MDKTKGKNNKKRNEININNKEEQKAIKIQRMSTDIDIAKTKNKFKNFSGKKKSGKKIRDSYNIPRQSFPLSNINNINNQLNKTIVNNNIVVGDSRLTKTYDKNNKKKLNNNKTKLINRINLNKKENPFFINYNSNV